MTNLLRNKDNDALRFPFSAAPVPGTLTDVAPGVKWLRMPLPFALDHINLWVLDDGDGWTLVDTGINSAKTREVWGEIFAGPLKDKPVKRVICTHFHPDHIGLAGWLTEMHGAPLWVTPKEMTTARDTRDLTIARIETLMTAQYTRAGLGGALSDAIATRGNSYTKGVVPLPETFTAIDPAQPIAAGGMAWRVVVGEGHSPQLAALYAEKSDAGPGILISGDQVLPGISPNVSVRFVEAIDDNPLKLFLDSLARFRTLPADTLVLPSHKLPFYGLHERIDQIVHHHHDRLDVARRACIGGATAGDVLTAMFQRRFDAHQLNFALGETLAHLNYLIAAGDVVRELTGQGVDQYTLVSSPAAAA
jgi:glyoxylase-like metal-dependent hydrolase (beta-lactamase superfamily II)